VRLTVYDVSGRRVARPADRSFGAGRHEVEWPGADDRGRELPSGVYFVRMEAGTSEQTRRLVLLR
jgi:flagellar hook assembly protein FlgD